MVKHNRQRRESLTQDRSIIRLGFLAALVIFASGELNAIETTEPPATATESDSTDTEVFSARAWPQISLALQDGLSTENLAAVGVLNDAWCMSEYAVGNVTDHRLSRAEIDARFDQYIEDFINTPVERIQRDLERYLLRFPQLSRKTTQTIIIDIESPTQPRHFWRLLDGENHDQVTPRFTGVVQAFARRYAVVRSAFPNATLTVFSMGSPDWSGQDSRAAQIRLHAEVLAAKMGMLEDVDAISPELYERYGPQDAQFRTANQRALQALRHGVAVVQASGRPLDIIVLMTLTVFNDPNHSSIAGRPADLEGLANRLDYLASMGVRRVIFWNGQNHLRDSTISVAQRFRQLRATQRARAASPATADPPASDAAPPDQNQP